MGFASLNGRLPEVDVKVPVYVCQDCYNFEHTNNTTINSLLMHSTERTKVAINICQLRQPEQPRGQTCHKGYKLLASTQHHHVSSPSSLGSYKDLVAPVSTPPPFNRYMTITSRSKICEEATPKPTNSNVCDKQRIPEICECEKFVDLLMHFRYNSCVILSEVIFCLMRIIITSVITGICGNIS